MQRVCEEYAEECNLLFSTDPNPQSKSKCLFMCGYMDPDYPAPLKLCGRDLPWVVQATHLGQELHRLCNMELDANMERGQFIDISVKIEETFSFANPPLNNFKQSKPMMVIGMRLCCRTCMERSVDSCTDVGTPLWRWHGMFPMVHIPNFWTTSFLVAFPMWSSRFVNLCKNLLKSRSREVKVVANIIARHARSDIGSNLVNIQVETGMGPWKEEA